MLTLGAAFALLLFLCSLLDYVCDFHRQKVADLVPLVITFAAFAAFYGASVAIGE